MAGKNAHETMSQLIAAINAGEIDKALTLYHPDATFVAEPGKLATGANAIRGVLSDFIASKTKIAIERHETVEAGDVALYSTRWSLSGSGPDPVRMSGKGAVVLRRQEDGTWLIAIENPWTDAL